MIEIKVETTGLSKLEAQLMNAVVDLRFIEEFRAIIAGKGELTPDDKLLAEKAATDVTVAFIKKHFHDREVVIVP